METRGDGGFEEGGIRKGKLGERRINI